MLWNKHRFCILLALASAHLAAGRWLKMYEENYHRPTYYNRAHHSSDHVDYNRTAMDARDAAHGKVVKIPEFNSSVHKSFYVNILYKSSVICAGALYTRRMIITSSRCFLPTQQDPSYEFKARHMAVLPANNFNRPHVEPFAVKAFFLPSTKVKFGAIHSIALVALQEKLSRIDYPHIRLQYRVPPVGSQVVMSYLDSYSRELKLFNSKVVELDRCKRAYEAIGKTDTPFNKNVFCVKNTRKTVCSTRRGDPLIMDNLLAGINIYGEQCDELAGLDLLDVYYSIRRAIPFLQYATDLLRALTVRAPLSVKTTKTPLQKHPKTTRTTVSIITEAATEADIAADFLDTVAIEEPEAASQETAAPAVEQSTEASAEEQSTEASAEEQSTEASAEKQSTEASAEEHSTEASAEEQSTEASEEEQLTEAPEEEQSTEDPEEEQLTEDPEEEQSTEASEEEQSTEASEEEQSTEASEEEQSTEASEEEQSTEASEEEQSTEASEEEQSTEDPEEEQSTEASEEEQSTEASEEEQSTEASEEEQSTEASEEEQLTEAPEEEQSTEDSAETTETEEGDEGEATVELEDGS